MWPQYRGDPRCPRTPRARSGSTRPDVGGNRLAGGCGRSSRRITTPSAGTRMGPLLRLTVAVDEPGRHERSITAPKASASREFSSRPTNHGSRRPVEQDDPGRPTRALMRALNPRACQGRNVGLDDPTGAAPVDREVRSELATTFWVVVLLVNLALFAGSLGILLLLVPGWPVRASGLIGVGIAAGILAGIRYRRFQARSS